ncbi:1156_t:CDS:2 [Dentiscutata erythropus]|uniref:1156_t:CDS:1 n=1 Tax=Dentiscutata erythropus TaxID=1348616 RepID=A0A9N8WU81_9GLOM|nr:1156_t:CDS:2 [Dentiscutata erythropus]
MHNQILFNTALLSFNHSSNKFGDEGIKVFVKALHKNSTMQFNCINGGKALAKLLQKHEFDHLGSLF